MIWFPFWGFFAHIHVENPPLNSVDERIPGPVGDSTKHHENLLERNGQDKRINYPPSTAANEIYKGEGHYVEGASSRRVADRPFGPKGTGFVLKRLAIVEILYTMHTCMYIHLCQFLPVNLYCKHVQLKVQAINIWKKHKTTRVPLLIYIANLFISWPS